MAIYERGREAKIGTYKTQNNRDGLPQGMMSDQNGDLTGQKLFTVSTTLNETGQSLTSQDNTMKEALNESRFGRMHNICMGLCGNLTKISFAGQQVRPPSEIILSPGLTRMLNSGPSDC